LTDAIERIRARVAKRVTPTKKERGRVLWLLEKFTAKARDEAEARGLQARVEIEGSIAKDTWISTDRDLDVFLIFPPGTDGEMVKVEGLELAKASAGSKWSLGYAEHPYVEAEIDGFTLDIVPSLEMKEGEKPTTSVDRTPLHTRFVGERLDVAGRTEVRILKQFLKGVGVYGAELKVGGFSGYIAELLVIRFGTFAEVIKAVAGWRGRACIDIAGHYSGQNLEEVFEGNLVIVDPVDRSRNAAAAVSTQSYFTFIAAAKHFLEKPRLSFFYPARAEVKPKMVLETLASKGSHLVAVVTSCPHVPSDILWGEAYRSMRRIAALLAEEGFQVNDSVAWSDERELLVFLFELQELGISAGRLHLGPMVMLTEEADSFLEKYRSRRGVLAGPYIRGERWAVELRREHDSASSLLSAKLKGVRFSKDVEREFRKGYQILVDRQLAMIMEERQGLAALVLQLLRKRPPWLSH
jgi:tRNA nucleotidyltransferase (CCA-adding enzyme)